MKKSNKHVFIFLGFLLVTLIFRSVSFFLSVIDTDESLYLLMANSLLHGDVLYSTIFDHKPPGIYLIFALSKIVFHNSIFAIRIAACLSIASSAYFLFLISKRLLKGKGVLNFLPGVLYILFSLNNGGLASNTEIFFSPFVLWAFYLLLTLIYKKRVSEIPFYSIFIIGLLLGIGLQIKYIVLFDYGAVILIIYIYYFLILKKGKDCFKKLFLDYSLLTIGFFLPFLLVMVYFLLIGEFVLYFQSNFKPNIVNSTNTVFSFLVLFKSLYVFLQHNFLLCLGGIGAFFLMVKKKDKDPELLVLLFLFVWLLFTFFGVCYTKMFYSHYYLQTLPPLCLLCGFLLIKIYDHHLTTLKQYMGLGLIVLPSFYYVTTPYLELELKIIKHRFLEHEENWGDTSGKIAAYIKDKLDANDYIYIANYEPIIYDLTNAQIPTKFVFPFFLIKEHFATVAGVDVQLELKSIMGKAPKFVVYNPVKEKTMFYRSLKTYLNSSYSKVKTIDEIEIYKRSKINHLKNQ